MARMDVCRIIERMRIPWDSEISVMEIYDTIMNFCRENQTAPSKHTYTIDNGCLYIDGNFTKRVGPIERPAYVFDEEAAYYAEGKDSCKAGKLDGLKWFESGK